MSKPARQSGLPAFSPPSTDDGSFLGVHFDPVTSDAAVERLIEMVATGNRGWVATVNVAILMQLRDDRDLRRYVEESSLIVADGQPIVWGSRLVGTTLPSRVTGIDIIERLCDAADQDGLSIFLLGGTAAIVEEAARRLREDRPRLRITCRDGYYPENEAPRIAEEIRSAETDFLIVGMGVPRQERFIQRHWETLGCPVAIGVGGSFDVLAGRLRRAPLWIQRSGLEWLYRLLQEPRRLFARYAVTNAQFSVAYLQALSCTRRRPTSGVRQLQPFNGPRRHPLGTPSGSLTAPPGSSASRRSSRLHSTLAWRNPPAPRSAQSSP